MELVSSNYLRKKIKGIGCYLEGEFILKSGEKSSYYVDLRKIISYPDLIRDVCNCIYHSYIKDIMRYNITRHNLQHSGATIRIMGVPYGAIPYASIISSMHDIPLIILRKEQKEHGTKKLIEGDYNDDDSVIIIEDVITSGNSVIDSIKKLNDNKLNVIGVVSLFDRGGIKNLNYNMVKHSTYYPPFAQSLFNYMDFKLNMTDKIRQLANDKSRLVFSNDITNKKEFLVVLDQMDNISFLKMHSDTIEQFDDQFISYLLEIKRRNGFMIIEDRKFADIGSVVKQQIQHNQIHKWADLVTVHCIAGESTIKGIIEMDMNMLLIGEMSSSDNLITQNYTNNVVALAHKYKDHVNGFISQKSLSPDFFTFTPGVNIDITHDNLGQTYSTPESLKQSGTDFFIVGRGIYNSKMPYEMAKKYIQSIENGKLE